MRPAVLILDDNYNKFDQREDLALNVILASQKDSMAAFMENACAIQRAQHVELVAATKVHLLQIPTYLPE